jgi:hypothetical protein
MILSPLYIGKPTASGITYKASKEPHKWPGGPFGKSRALSTVVVSKKNNFSLEIFTRLQTDFNKAALDTICIRSCVIKYFYEIAEHNNQLNTSNGWSLIDELPYVYVE